MEVLSFAPFLSWLIYKFKNTRNKKRECNWKDFLKYWEHIVFSPFSTWYWPSRLSLLVSTNFSFLVISTGFFYLQAYSWLLQLPIIHVFALFYHPIICGDSTCTHKCLLFVASLLSWVGICLREAECQDRRRWTWFILFFFSFFYFIFNLFFLHFYF